jgi:hypothetical protein
MHLNAIFEFFPSAFLAEWKIPDGSKIDFNSYELHVAINPQWPPVAPAEGEGMKSVKVRVRTESRITAFRYCIFSCFPYYCV